MTQHSNYQTTIDEDGDEWITIPKGVYTGLVQDQKYLDALIAGGVDNWCGYDAALDNLED